MNAETSLALHFFGLPCVQRHEAAAATGLTEAADEGATEQQRYSRYFKRVRQRNLLHRLWAEVDGRTDGTRGHTNPFPSPEEDRRDRA
jgi:GTPase-associated adaptor domain